MPQPAQGWRLSFAPDEDMNRTSTNLALNRALTCASLFRYFRPTARLVRSRGHEGDSSAALATRDPESPPARRTSRWRSCAAGVRSAALVEDGSEEPRDPHTIRLVGRGSRVAAAAPGLRSNADLSIYSARTRHICLVVRARPSRGGAPHRSGSPPRSPASTSGADGSAVEWRDRPPPR